MNRVHVIPTRGIKPSIMPESNQSSWKPFAVGRPSTHPNWTETACQPLEQIYHVTHVRHAITILDDRLIRKRPVYDESILNTTRVHVVWLSPNNWSGADASRYGNVRFVYDWRTLVKDMKAYWVGTMDYSPVACRILLTQNERSSSILLDNGTRRPLLPYTPESGDGPWWHDAAEDRHWWNGNFCLEILIERDLRTDDACDLDFEDHSAVKCSIEPGDQCRDAKRRHWQAAPELLAAWTSGALAGRAFPHRCTKA